MVFRKVKGLNFRLFIGNLLTFAKNYPNETEIENSDKITSCNKLFC